MGVSTGVASADQRSRLLALYESGVREVYGYLLHRVGSVALAEDLTNECFESAARALVAGRVESPTIAWLITIARNKLIDHWRREAREERHLRDVGVGVGTVEDPWSTDLDEGRALATLRKLSPHHRAVLTLRYLDGLSVQQSADILGRTLHATESLLVRSRAAFRKAYSEASDE